MSALHDLAGRLRMQLLDLHSVSRIVTDSDVETDAVDTTRDGSATAVRLVHIHLSPNAAAALSDVLEEHHKLTQEQ